MFSPEEIVTALGGKMFWGPALITSAAPDGGIKTGDRHLHAKYTAVALCKAGLARPARKTLLLALNGTFSEPKPDSEWAAEVESLLDWGESRVPPDQRMIKLADEAPLMAGLDTLSVSRALDLEEIRLEGEVERIATGLRRLDRALDGGFEVGSLVVMGAAPKSLKSTLSQSIAEHHATHGGFVYHLDLENGRRRALRRLLCRRAKIGPKAISQAMANPNSPAFDSLRAAEAWNAAKAYLRNDLGNSLYMEFSPPHDFVMRIAEARRLAGDRKLLVIIDSLQKMPGSLEDRRAVIDSWVRMFERLRHEYNATFFVISEIKRSGKGTYEANESAFKESGGIEYSADLAMTLARPRADEDEENTSTLRIELARDSFEDPRGEVASYSAVFPYYGIEERDPVKSEKGKPGPKPDKLEAAKAFLNLRLADGPMRYADLLLEAQQAGISRPTLNRARDAIGVTGDPWRLP